MSKREKVTSGKLERCYKTEFSVRKASGRHGHDAETSGGAGVRRCGRCAKGLEEYSEVRHARKVNVGPGGTFCVRSNAWETDPPAELSEDPVILARNESSSAT